MYAKKKHKVCLALLYKSTCVSYILNATNPPHHPGYIQCKAPLIKWYPVNWGIIFVGCCAFLDLMEHVSTRVPKFIKITPNAWV